MNYTEKIIRANNLLQFIHQVTIEYRTISLEIDKCKSNNAASVSEVLALFIWSSEGYI